MPISSNSPIQSILVYRADAFMATEGVNQGEEISPADELVLDDVYKLKPDTKKQRLSLHIQNDGGFSVAADTGVGRIGGSVHLDAALSLVSSEGVTVDALLLVEVDAGGHIADIYLLPLAPMRAESSYTLIGVRNGDARETLAKLASATFIRGTHITLASGVPAPIETLKAGDKVLTRDHGSRAIRWIGQSSVRATGNMSLIVIREGALGNENDLIVSPNHRLYVPQQSDGADLLIKARHLINGDTIFEMEGGRVDYFQILFDRPHLVYAEGLAADSAMIEPRVKPALPQDLLDKLSPIMHARDKSAPDMTQALLHRPDALDLLRRATVV